MKQTILSTAVATAIMFGITGCGDEKTESHTAQQVKEAVPAVSLEKRKSAFDTKVKTLANQGFDINRTKEDHYLLTVKNEKQAIASLLGLTNMSTLDPEQRVVLEELLKEGKVGIEVNWDKYAANEKESVFVYYLGNGNEPSYIQKLFTERKIGAYLSFNGKDQLTQVKVKDIDETIKVDSDTTHIILKDMHAEIKKAFTKVPGEYTYDLYGGTFSYILTDTEDNDTLTLGYKNPECNVEKTNYYLGKYQCRFPLIDIDLNTTFVDDRGIVHFSINDMDFSYESSVHKKKVKGVMDFKIASIDMNGKSTEKYGTMHIKDIKIAGNTDNIDEAVLKSYMELLSNPSKEYNETIRKMMSFVGELYSSGMTLDYHTSIASAEGESNEATFVLDTYEGHGKGSFDHNINYKDLSSVKQIAITDKKSKKPLFDLKNFRFGYEITDLYNFLPAFMEFSGELVTTDQSKEEELLEKKLTKMGTDLVHNGFGFSLDPIGWDALQAEIPGQELQLGKADLSIAIKLKKNDIPLDANTPKNPMILLPYFESDGKLVLSKKDLEQLSTSMPPQVIGMLMMFAKYEGENAVFILKFENGHLVINGKPLM
jgi:hypothetical protein